MRTITVREKTGADGVLKLSIPLGVAETECEVVVVVQPGTQEPTGRTGDHPSWPPGFLDRIVGGWQGELERPPQPPAEVPGATDDRQPTPEELGWPPGFFEETAGAWQGEFELPPQGEFEKREEL